MRYLPTALLALLAWAAMARALTITSRGRTTRLRSYKRSVNMGLQHFSNITGKAAYIEDLCSELKVDLQGRIAVVEHVGCTTSGHVLQLAGDGGALGIVLWDTDELLDVGERVTQRAGIVANPPAVAAVEISLADSKRLLTALQSDPELTISISSEGDVNPWLQLLLGAWYTALMRVMVPMLWTALIVVSSMQLTLRLRRYGFHPRSRVAQLLTMLSIASALLNAVLLLLGAEGQGGTVILRIFVPVTTLADTSMLMGVAIMATVWRVSLRSKHAHAVRNVVKRHTARWLVIAAVLGAVSIANSTSRSGFIALRPLAFTMQFICSVGFAAYFILSARLLLRRLQLSGAATAPKAAHVAADRSAVENKLPTDLHAAGGSSKKVTSSFESFMSKLSKFASSDASFREGGGAGAGSSSAVVKPLPAEAGTAAITSGSRRRKLSRMAYWLRIASVALLCRVLALLSISFIPHRPVPWLITRLFGSLADFAIVLSVVMSMRRASDPLLPNPCGKKKRVGVYTLTTMASRLDTRAGSRADASLVEHSRARASGSFIATPSRAEVSSMG